MNKKYFDELYKPWFIFGENNDFVDVSDSDKDIVTNIKKGEAIIIIKERDLILDLLYEFMNKDKNNE